MEVMNRKYILIGLLVCITGIFSGCHSWLDVQPEDQDKMIIHIDPGTAFGTGMHEGFALL